MIEFFHSMTRRKTPFECQQTHHALVVHLVCLQTLILLLVGIGLLSAYELLHLKNNMKIPNKKQHFTWLS